MILAELSDPLVAGAARPIHVLEKYPHHLCCTERAGLRAPDSPCAVAGWRGTGSLRPSGDRRDYAAAIPGRRYYDQY